MLGSMHLVSEDVGDNQLFHESRLKEIFEPVFRGNFLRLADVVDDLPDVAH